MQKFFLLFALLLFVVCAQGQNSQFVIERTNGFATLSPSTSLDNTQKGQGYVVGGVDVGEISKISRSSRADFQLRSWNANAYSVMLSLVPRNPEQKYIVQLEPKASFLVHNITDRSQLVNELLMPRWQAWEYALGYTHQQYLDSLLRHGSIPQMQALDLQANTDYVLYAFGYNDKDSFLTPVYTHEFRTTPVDSTNAQMSLQVTTNGNVATLSAQCADTTVHLYVDALSDRDFQTYGDGTGDTSVVIDNYLKIFRNFFSLPAHDFYDNMTRTSNYTKIMDWLNANTQYTAFVVAVDRGMHQRSKPVVLKFQTSVMLHSDNNIRVEVKNLSSTDAIVECTPSNRDNYVCQIMPDSLVDGLSDDSLVTYLENKYKDYFNGGPFMLGQFNSYSGKSTVFASSQVEPVAGQKYYAVVFGYQTESLSSDTKGHRTTEMQRIPFTLLSEPQKASEISFFFNSESEAGVGVAWAVYPSEPSVSYYCNYYPDSLTDNEIFAALNDSASLQGVSLPQYLKEHAVRGVSEVYAVPSMGFHLQWNVPYKAVAISLNEDGSYAQSSFSCSESVAVPPVEAKSLRISAKAFRNQGIKEAPKLKRFSGLHPSLGKEMLHEKK